MQKLGGFLFFGCGGGGTKDTGKLKNQNNNESWKCDINIYIILF